MSSPSFRRARSAARKQERADSLIAAARSLAMESGVVAVTLSGVAERAGVHYSAVRRYFSSHKDVLLHLAEEGWLRWSAGVRVALREQGGSTPDKVAEVLALGLSADPLFCDLLANVPLRLERDLDVQRVLEFKRATHPAVTAMADAIGDALPGLAPSGGIDLVTSANALAATLWQLAHPPPALAEAYAANPEISRLAAVEFTTTLTRLLAATCRGLLAAHVETSGGPEQGA